jgi:uncharacterized protein (TIGR00369 family)
VTTAKKPGASEIEAFLLESFPHDKQCRVEELTGELVRLRWPVDARDLRPGATVSGPVIMAIADSAAWVLIMHNLGFDAAPSVTSNLSMSFLSRPAATDLLATGRLLKLGKRLSVTEVRLYSEGREQLVAHATVTYAIVHASGG